MTQSEMKHVEYRRREHGFEPILQVGDPHSTNEADQDIDPDKIFALYAEGNDSYLNVQDRSGRPNELIVMNADKTSSGIVLQQTTPNSGGKKNPGNVLELAYRAYFMPDYAHVMWTSYGNNPTGRMSRADQASFTANGRYTKGSGTDEDPFRPLDAFYDLAELLDDHDLLPTHILDYQEAGRLAAPLMLALGRNTLKGVELDGLDGLSKGAKYARSQPFEDIRSRLERRFEDHGNIDAISPTNIKALKDSMPNVYRGLGRYMHLAPILYLLSDDVDLAKKVYTYSRDKFKDLDDPANHAVLQDLRAGLSNQEVNVNISLSAESSQHPDMEACIEFGRLLMDSLDVQTDKEGKPSYGVTLDISEHGKWSENTDAPTESAARKRFGIPGILPRLALVASRVQLSQLDSKRDKAA